MLTTMKDEFDQHKQSFETMKNDFEQRQQDLEARVAKLEELIRIGTLRSCAEYSKYGLKTNGFYLIDPDGPLLGQPPFEVFCNFTSGSTEILHDSEMLTEVEHCHDPGCYEKPITYIDPQSEEEVPRTQIESLIELSETCVQSFYYDCTLAPLQDEMDFAFWVDRHGGNNTYFTGGLNFDLQSAAFRLGRLQCFGNKDVDIGTSCSSLKKNGVYKSGYYNIKTDSGIKIVFCDMESGIYDDVDQTVEDPLIYSPLGTILPWVPKPDKNESLTTVDVPEGWQKCDGSLIP